MDITQVQRLAAYLECIRESYGIAEAKRNLPQIVNSLGEGEIVLINNRGTVKAVLVTVKYLQQNAGNRYNEDEMLTFGKYQIKTLFSAAIRNIATQPILISNSGQPQAVILSVDDFLLLVTEECASQTEPTRPSLVRINL